MTETNIAAATFRVRVLFDRGHCETFVARTTSAHLDQQTQYLGPTSDAVIRFKSPEGIKVAISASRVRAISYVRQEDDSDVQRG